MRRANPAFIPRNHRVEEAIEAAVRRSDFGPFEVLADVLARPYDDQPDFAYLADPPGADQRVVPDVLRNLTWMSRAAPRCAPLVGGHATSVFRMTARR